MNSSKPDNQNHSDTHDRSEPLSDDEYADVYLDKPIDSREYLKLLGYCVIGLIGVGLVIAVLFNLID